MSSNNINEYKNRMLISFPRSGQGLIEKILNYLCEKHDIPFSYCEFYTCCKKIPCKKKSFFQKNHDFHLKLNINSNYQYIILYRKDKIKQLEAYYRYRLHNNWNDAAYDYNNLLSYIKENSNYYDNFIKKWISNTLNHPNFLYIEYYDLVNDPLKWSKILFSYIFPQINIQEQIFINMLNDIPIKIFNSISDDVYSKLQSDLLL